MWSKHCRVVEKQGLGKYNREATWHQLRAPNVTIWTHFGVILASDSEKKHEKGRSRKTCFLGERQNARPGAMTASECPQDVRPRRPEGAICNGKLKAGKQNTPHLGPGFEPKGGTSDNQSQNYLYAHLLKGGLSIY